MWRLQANSAQLQHGGITATLDLQRPAMGLSNVRDAADHPVPGQFLQVHLPPAQANGEESLTECFVRQNDLVASYAQTDSRTVRPQIVWHAAQPVPQAAAVDLLLAMQTSLLECAPQTTTISDIHARDVWRCRDPQQERLEPCSLEPGAICSLGRVQRGATRFVLFRFDELPLSYVEMVHPSDFAGASLQRSPDPDGPVRLMHQLFPESLEKGVIRRARVRGAFLPRQGDEELARACFQKLCADSPPLTA